MSVEETVDVQVIVGSADITKDVIFAQSGFQVVAAAQPGTSQVVVRDPHKEYEFTPGKDVIQWKLNGDLMWKGYLFTVEQGYQFEAATERRWVLSGVDLNILFDKLILYNHAHPNWGLDGGGTYQRERTSGGWVVKVPQHTEDRPYIIAMIGGDSDIGNISPAVNYSAKVATVGQINPDGNFTPPSPGLTLRAFMQDVSANVARSMPGSSIWYIDPSGYLNYRETDKDIAPFSVGDDEGSVAVKSLSVTTDISRIKNDVLIFAGDLNPLPGSTQSQLLYVRNSLSASTTLFGRFQYSEVLGSDWLQGAVNARSTKILFQEGGSAVRAEFITYKHGLFPGQVVTITSGVHTFRWFDPTKGTGTNPASYMNVGPAINVPIRAIDVTFPTPGVAAYRVTCSYDTQDPWGLLLALKRPPLKGLTQPGFVSINRLKVPPDRLEYAQPYTFVKERPKPLGGGVWQCSYAYIRDSLVVFVNGLRRVSLPEGDNLTVGFIQTDPDTGKFKIDSGTPYVEYHVWHNRPDVQYD